MATMNISLPDAMKDWVEQRAETGSFSNSSDYVRDLIRRDQIRQGKVLHMQALVNEALASGDGSRSLADLREAALAEIAKSEVGKDVANDGG